MFEELLSASVRMRATWLCGGPQCVRKVRRRPESAQLSRVPCALARPNFCLTFCTETAPECEHFPVPDAAPVPGPVDRKALPWGARPPSQPAGGSAALTLVVALHPGL